MGGGLRVPRLRPRPRVPRAVGRPLPPGARHRPRRHGTRLPRRRVRAQRRRGAGPALDRAARPLHGRRPLPDRPPGPLLPQPRPAVPARAGGRGPGRARRRVPQPVPQHPGPRRGGRLRGGRGAAAHRRLRAAAPSGHPGAASGGDRPRRHRGPARPALPPLRPGPGRAHPGRPDRPADVAEPGGHRGRPAPLRRGPPPPRRRGPGPALRAGDPQLRPLHLLLHPLPRPDRGARVTIVIGVGNDLRRDDGAGPAVVAALRGRVEAGLAVTDGEPARLVDLWAGADLAIVVDAVRADPPAPGRVRELDAETAALPARPVSDHALGLGDAVALGRAVGRMPARLRVIAIEGADFDFGEGLTPRVAAAVGAVADRLAGALASERGTALPADDHTRRGGG
ncbi:hydrogenase maturation protease [Actinomadura sp. DSM 109109]|nr:hydrogenase maturation protease [Actinomadura lepetitiana]